MLPATLLNFLMKGAKLKFNWELLLMPKYTLAVSAVLSVPGGVWVSLDPMLAHHAAGSDKHMHTAVSPLNNCGGTQAACDPGQIFLYLGKNSPASAGCWPSKLE